MAFSNKQGTTPKRRGFLLVVTSTGFTVAHPAKLRFENSTNKKTLKQAWRFFLLYYLFVTSTGFKPVTF